MTDAQHEEEHAACDSFLDYVKLIFHSDMGDGHLEHVQVDNGPTLTGSVAYLPSIQPVIFSEYFLLAEEKALYSPTANFGVQYPPDNIYYNPSLALRGPPTFS